MRWSSQALQNDMAWDSWETRSLLTGEHVSSSKPHLIWSFSLSSLLPHSVIRISTHHFRFLSSLLDCGALSFDSPATHIHVSRSVTPTSRSLDSCAFPSFPDTSSPYTVFSHVALCSADVSLCVCVPLSAPSRHHPSIFQRRIRHWGYHQLPPDASHQSAVRDRGGRHPQVQYGCFQLPSQLRANLSTLQVTVTAV